MNQTAALVERIRQRVTAERATLVGGSDESGPAAVHLRRAVSRMAVLLAELDAVARHLKRAAEAERSDATSASSARSAASPRCRRIAGGSGSAIARGLVHDHRGTGASCLRGAPHLRGREADLEGGYSVLHAHDAVLHAHDPGRPCAHRRGTAPALGGSLCLRPFAGGWHSCPPAPTSG
jgi:hypothetical protein